jgi:hypothetical protein
MIALKKTTDQRKAHKTDAGNGSCGIHRVIDASRSPSPDLSRSANELEMLVLQIFFYDSEP